MTTAGEKKNKTPKHVFLNTHSSFYVQLILNSVRCLAGTPRPKEQSERQAGKTSQTSRFPENHRGGNSPSQRCHTKGIPAQLCSLRSSAVRDIPTLLPPWRGKEHSAGCHSGLRIQLWDDRTPREISFLHLDYITSQNWVVLWFFLSLSFSFSAVK